MPNYLWFRDGTIRSESESLRRSSSADVQLELTVNGVSSIKLESLRFPGLLLDVIAGTVPSRFATTATRLFLPSSSSSPPLSLSPRAPRRGRSSAANFLARRPELTLHHATHCVSLRGISSARIPRSRHFTLSFCAGRENRGSEQEKSVHLEPLTTPLLLR